MTEIEYLGMLIPSLVTVGGLFAAIHKPLTENTKAMTTLSLQVQQLTKQFEKGEQNFEAYKIKVNDSQRRQWEVLDRHSKKLVKHDAELDNLKVMVESKGDEKHEH
jgi:hypothetical protein